MFETVQPAPPDAILGLTEAFRNDPNPHKINLSVGVYQDSSGKTPILGCVKAAEKQLIHTESTKSYLPITGDPNYGGAVQKLMFGPDHEIIASGRASTAHSPGGTGGLRVAADFIRRTFPDSKIWMSDPTWPNHPNIFHAAGVPFEAYPYFNPETNGIRAEEMLRALSQIPSGDILLLHGCCHNPSGIDPAPELWEQIASIVKERQLLALVDFAYQGFGDGFENDSEGMKTLADAGCEMIVVSSFSKNFGLYRERAGAVTLIAHDSQSCTAATTQLKAAIRANYSNPPAHGAFIVATVLGSEELRSRWTQEVAEMRDRINGMRKALAETLHAQGVSRDFSFMTAQRGMFSFSGLTPEQVDELRSSYSIYIVRSGRINVAGITPDNIDRLCTAIATVLS